MSDGHPENTQKDAGNKQDDSQLSLEIFRRDLNEVHLLMDFISSLPGKGLSDLILPNPDPGWKPTSENRKRPDLDSADSVMRISAIRFPPSPNPATRAAEATVLLLAKDKLNDLARPARGRSIAYTTMFSSGVPWSSRKRNPSRYDLALGAFPELVRHVHLFKFLYWFLLIFGLVWLLFTGFTYWDVALGNSVLKNIAAIETERDNLYKANPTLADCRVSTAAGRSESPGQGAAPGQSTACLRLEQLRLDKDIAATELVKYAGCSGVWRFLALRCWPGTEFVGRTLDPRLANANTIFAVLSVLSTYVLPMMFGILGTLVAAFRSLHDQIRDSLLSPRDSLLVLTSLPIGAIAGLTVGLFFSAPQGTITGLSGLPSTISLSVAGLAFLTGYAADAFFSFLDSVRSQVFRATNPPPSSDAAVDRTARVSPRAAPTTTVIHVDSSTARGPVPDPRGVSPGGPTPAPGGAQPGGQTPAAGGARP